MSDLTPNTFDRIATPARPTPARVLWTADGIARRIGTSPDYVRDTLAKIPGSPVKKIGRRYCAIEADLIEFFRSYPDNSQLIPIEPIERSANKTDIRGHEDMALQKKAAG
ncbi:hypothetical protein [Stappia sp.]|uniref:hypothetical protein n=1 Tax=Stappia sp. TaxID=1870903 RepID=UPI0025F8AA39|nr:hypothetical protein [Stappia sp.]